MQIPEIDFFAGPGVFSEGFNRVNGEVRFRVNMSQYDQV